MRQIILEDLPVEEREKYLHKSRSKPLSPDANSTRYRCEQTNIIKLNGVINAHSTVKAEYLLSFPFENQNKIAEVKLEDSIYNFFTKGTEELVGFLSSSDRIKSRMLYELDSRGKIKNISNFLELRDLWKKYRNNISDNSFVKKLDQDAKKRIVESGDIEFYSPKILLKNANTNLFNQIILNQYLVCNYSDFQNEILKTRSHFFPDIEFDVNCEVNIYSESDNRITFQEIGLPTYVNISDMIALYEKFYKEQLQYRFTDYSYKIRMDYTIDKTDNRIMTASVSINEAVKNNMESQVLFHLKRVEL